MPTYNTHVARTTSGSDPLIPEPLAAQIIQEAPRASAALSLMNKTTLSAKTQRQPVLDVLPVAYWVGGDTGMKQTSLQAWKNVVMVVEEISIVLDTGRTRTTRMFPAGPDSATYHRDRAASSSTPSTGSQQAVHARRGRLPRAGQVTPLHVQGHLGGPRQDVTNSARWRRPATNQRFRMLRRVQAERRDSGRPRVCRSTSRI
jgi:hypothetical protein